MIGKGATPSFFAIANYNYTLTDYVLSDMDVGSDSYVLMILTKEDFIKAKELAREILNRIAVVEET